MGETEEWDIDPVATFSIILYKLNDEEEDFEKVEIKSVEEIHPHLVSGNILLVIDTEGHNAYLLKYCSLCPRCALWFKNTY